MKKTIGFKSKIALGLFTVALVAGGTVAANAGSTQAPPKLPPWVDAKTGKVDMSKMPDYMPVPGPDGKNKKDKDGKDIMVKIDKGPPPPPQDELDVASGKKTRKQVEEEQAKQPRTGVETFGDVPKK